MFRSLLIPLKFNKKNAIFSLFTNFASLARANESISGKFVRVICALTYEEYLGQKISAVESEL